MAKQVSWFDNLIKTNNARKKAGEVWQGPKNVGDRRVDDTYVRASELGALDATERPFVSQTKAGPLSPIEKDRVETLFKPTSLQTGPDPVLQVPYAPPEKQVIPDSMMIGPKSDDPTERRTFEDGSRDPVAYGKYLFGDRFSDKERAVALDYLQNPDRFRTPQDMSILHRVYPEAQNGTEQAVLAPLNTAQGLADQDKMQRVVGGGLNLLDNLTGKLGNLRKGPAQKKESPLEIITDGQDPETKDGERWDYNEANWYYRMPNGRVYQDLDLKSYKYDAQTDEVILADGSRFSVDEFDEAADPKKAFYGLPDGTKLDPEKMGLVQADRNPWILNMNVENPKTPFQDAMGRNPGDDDYNLFDNFTKAGWTETVPFLTDALLTSAPRMVNKYLAGGLAVNDSVKGYRGIDRSTMEPAEGWDLFGSPTYEPKGMSEGERIKQTLMPYVESLTEYQAPILGKALGKTGAIKSVGGDFMSEGIERFLAKRLGGKLIPAAGASGITEALEEGSSGGIESILSYFLTPDTFGQRDENGPSAPMGQRIAAEAVDNLTGMFAGGALGSILGGAQMLGSPDGPQYTPRPAEEIPMPRSTVDRKHSPTVSPKKGTKKPIPKKGERD